MRDLSAHPITLDEIVRYLEDLSLERAKEGRVGDMGPLLLRTAAAILRRAEFVTRDIGKGL